LWLPEKFQPRDVLLLAVHSEHASGRTNDLPDLRIAPHHPSAFNLQLTALSLRAETMNGDGYSRGN
jgi:hypothetical protein